MLIPFVQDLCHVPEHKRNCFRQESIRFLHSEVSSWWIVLTLKEVKRQLNYLDLIINYIQPNTHSREVCVKYYTKSKMNVLCQTLQGCTTRSGQWSLTKNSSFWESQPRINVLWFSGLRNMYFQNSMLDGVPSSDHSLLERHGLAEHNLLLEKIVLPGEQPKLFFQELGSSIEISCSLPKNVQLWMKFFAWTLCPDLEEMCLLWIALLRNGVRLASNQDVLKSLTKTKKTNSDWAYDWILRRIGLWYQLKSISIDSEWPTVLVAADLMLVWFNFFSSNRPLFYKSDLFLQILAHFMYLCKLFSAILEQIGICYSTVWSVGVPAITNECVLCLIACKMHHLA